MMIGTGPFGLPTFRELLATGHEMAALVTGPLKQRRGRTVGASPLREIAAQHGTPVFDRNDVNCGESREELGKLGADFLVVCDFGQILSADCLATTRLGGINLHASLLPKYRGAAPINWALFHGERETGVSVIHMVPRIDAGPVIAQGSCPIEPDETAEALEARLAEFGVQYVLEAIDLLDSGKCRPLPQDPALASQAPRLKKTDGAIDWNRPAEAIKNQVRALVPWPKTYTHWHRVGSEPLRLIISEVSVVEGADSKTPPGTVLEAVHRLVVSTADGALELRGVQPAGKRALAIEQFLRGYAVLPGDQFAPE